MMSRDDIEMTKEIAKAAEVLGISIHDHLVIGRKGHASFRSHGQLLREWRSSTESEKLAEAERVQFCEHPQNPQYHGREYIETTPMQRPDSSGSSASP
jgi:hypothetical protein